MDTPSLDDLESDRSSPRHSTADIGVYSSSELKQVMVQLSAIADTIREKFAIIDRKIDKLEQMIFNIHRQTPLEPPIVASPSVVPTVASIPSNPPVASTSTIRLPMVADPVVSYQGSLPTLVSPPNHIFPSQPKQ